MSTPQQSAAPAPATGTNRNRKRMLLLLTIVILIAAIAYGFYYFMYARFHEDTDDAYVNGNVVQITSQVVGTVIAVNADNTQTVKAGDPLVILDPADAKVRLEQTEADLAQMVRQVRTLYVNNNAYAADLAQRQTDLSRTQDDLKRRLAVAQSGAVSGEEIAHARDAVRAAQSMVDAAREQLASNRALTDNTTIAEHPNVKAAAAKVRDAYLNFARNTLPAPVSGYVAQRSVQVGQRVAPGTPLMAIVPLKAVWIDANFKEVQLRRMRVGQPVTATADVYGSSVVYHGHVEGFSAGTGSAFSLLPAQNATGNWIKVVQRLPVRVALDPQELQQHPLRIGLSMLVNVDIGDQNGAPLTETGDRTSQTNVFAAYGDEADAEIARIIAANDGSVSNAAANDAAKPAHAPAASAAAAAAVSKNPARTVATAGKTL